MIDGPIGDLQPRLCEQRQADQLLAVFAAQLEPVMVIDAQGRILKANPAAVEALGVDPVNLPEAELARRLSVRHPDGRPIPPGNRLAVRALRGETVRDEYRLLLTADGLERAIVASAAPIVTDGQISGAVVVWHDVTDLKRAEARLQVALDHAYRSQKEISALLAGARLILDQRSFADSARILFETCKNLTGAQAGYVALLSLDGSESQPVFLDSGGLPCTVDPMLSMPIRGLRGLVYNAGKAVFENAFSASSYAELLPAGHVEVDNLLLAPLMLSDHVVGLMGLANKPGGFDGDDVRVAEAFGELAAMALQSSRLTESLEASEKRFRAVLETANAAIITSDSRGQIASWNRMAELMFGHPAGEMVGSPLIRIVPERFRSAHYEGMARARTTGDTKLAGETVESVGVRSDGTEFPLEMSLAAWRGAEGSSFTAIMHDITERKRVEESLRQANQSIEALIQASPVAIITLDSELKVRLWNPAAERILGWSEQEMLGRPYLLVRSTPEEEDGSLIGRIWWRQPIAGYETQLQRKDGTLIDVAFWTSPLRNSEGQADGLMAILSDITERKQAEVALRRYAGDRAALYAVTAALSGTLDLDQLLTTSLDAALPYLKADAGWILLPATAPHSTPRVVTWGGTPPDLLDGEATPPRRGCPIYEGLSSGGDQLLNTQLVAACPRLAEEAPAGSALKSCVCVPLSAGGKLLGALKIGWREPRAAPERDQWLLMTIGRQAGMALHNAQLYQTALQVDRLRVLAAFDEAVAATLDPNKVAEETLQRAAAGLDAPAAVLVLLPQPTGANCRNQMYALREGRQTVEIPTEQAERWQIVVDRLSDGLDIQFDPSDELAAIYPDQDLARHWGHHGLAIAIREDKQLRAVLVLGGRPDNRPFTDEDRALAHLVASHAGQAYQNAQLYAELKDTLVERNQTRAQLVQSEKMAALGRLVASLTHEINNPLQSVQGCLTLLAEELQSQQRRAKMDRYLSVVQDEIERISTIVRRMREFSRPAREQMTAVDLRAVVKSVLELSSKQLQNRTVTVERDWRADLPVIEANPDHLKQVFLNLVLNAVDAMPGGGRLRIAISEDPIEVGGSGLPQPGLRIEFSDTGHGMSPAVMSRIFEPFFTTREDGSGLGLPISYSIIQAHHGEITVVSEEGAGSTFSIRLPATQPSGAR